MPHSAIGSYSSNLWEMLCPLYAAARFPLSLNALYIHKEEEEKIVFTLSIVVCSFLRSWYWTNVIYSLHCVTQRRQRMCQVIRKWLFGQYVCLHTQTWFMSNPRHRLNYDETRSRNGCHFLTITYTCSAISFTRLDVNSWFILYCFASCIRYTA
jgi:hypothetical protein